MRLPGAGRALGPRWGPGHGRLLPREALRGPRAALGPGGSGAGQPLPAASGGLNPSGSPVSPHPRGGHGVAAPPLAPLRPAKMAAGRRCLGATAGEGARGGPEGTVASSWRPRAPHGLARPRGGAADQRAVPSAAPALLPPQPPGRGVLPAPAAGQSPDGAGGAGAL